MSSGSICKLHRRRARHLATKPIRWGIMSDTWYDQEPNSGWYAAEQTGLTEEDVQKLSKLKMFSHLRAPAKPPEQQVSKPHSQAKLLGPQKEVPVKLSCTSKCLHEGMLTTLWGSFPACSKADPGLV